MAVTKRDDRGGGWWVEFYFTHSDGRKERIRKKSPVNTKDGATEYERQLRTTLLEGKRLSPEPAPELERKYTLGELWGEFTQMSAAANKASSFRAKQDIWKIHLCPEFGELNPGQISIDKINGYKNTKLKDSYSKKSINNHLIVLRALLGFALAAGKLARVPEIKKFPKGLEETDFLDFDEAERLISGSPEPWRAMIHFAIKTGLRRGEIIALRSKYVNLQGCSVRVAENQWRGVVDTTKSARARTVPLTPKLVEVLRAHRGSLSGRVFPMPTERRVDDEDVADRILEQCVRVAGVRPVGWHTLRHTFASHLVMRGVPLTVVQRYLGHSSSAMTERYAHLSPRVFQESILVLDQPPNSHQTTM